MRNWFWCQVEVVWRNSKCAHERCVKADWQVPTDGK